MKKFFLICLILVGAAASGNAQVQLSPSSEPKPVFDKLTGAAIIMPVLRTQAPLLASAEPGLKKAARVRNRSQVRANRSDTKRNGYYPGVGNRDWGTSMRMNHYFFLRPTVTSGL